MVTDPSPPASGNPNELLGVDDRGDNGQQTRVKIMHRSRALAAASAALLLAALMPQLAQAREIVGFSDTYSSGTVVVKTSERALYYVLGNGKAVRYPAGVVAASRGQARQAFAAECDSGRKPGQSHGSSRHDAQRRRRIRHPRHQQSRLDWRLRLLWLHPHVQRRRARSL